jgi:hypothetical protein
MNCDQVFDILTRGPFPTGTSCDAGVEAHLSACPECHRLAEALRPAIELFQEAVGPEESRDLPGYWSAVATDRTQPVVSFAPKVEPLRAMPAGWTNAAPSPHWSALTAWRMAAMLALGVTLGLLLSSRVAFDGISTPLPTTVGAGAVPPAPNDHTFQLTPAEQAALAVRPAACTRHQPSNGPRNVVRGDQLLANADLQLNHCCTECHNANSDNVPGAATAQVTQHCQMCHKEPATMPSRPRGS